jgi:uncharacterized protein (DUF433 family)
MDEEKSFVDAPFLLDRISLDARDGRACVRGTGIEVSHVLDCIAAGSPVEDIIEEYGLTLDDVRACVHYAARTTHTRDSGASVEWPDTLPVFPGAFEVALRELAESFAKGLLDAIYSATFEEIRAIAHPGAAGRRRMARRAQEPPGAAHPAAPVPPIAGEPPVDDRRANASTPPRSVARGAR